MSAGIGYSMPKIVASVINAVLGLFGTKPIPPCIDRAGTILEFPSRQLFHGNTQIPAACATAKQGGS